MGNRSEPFLEGIGALLDLAGEARGLKDHIDVNLKYGPFVAGIEVTQSIQYYQASQHLTDSKDRGPDNSVHLVANKPGKDAPVARKKISIVPFLVAHSF